MDTVRNVVVLFVAVVVVVAQESGDGSGEGRWYPHSHIVGVISAPGKGHVWVPTHLSIFAALTVSCCWVSGDGIAGLSVRLDR